MDVTVSMFVLLVAMAFVCEFIDAAIGMGYGTILAPVLIIFGFDPLLTVPAILFSQAFGGFAASVFHHRFHNVSFAKGSQDLKVVFVVSVAGIIATIIAACVALNIPKIYLQTYIGLLVLGMGILVFSQKKFMFSWKKIIGVAILSAFNKGLSGGGFGPVVTAGQIMAGQKHKAAIGATTLAEAPICIVGFCTYLIGRTIMELQGNIGDVPLRDFLHIMFSARIFHWELIFALFIGAVAVAPFGALATRSLQEKHLHRILGPLIIILGLWVLAKTYVF